MHPARFLLSFVLSSFSFGASPQQITSTATQPQPALLLQQSLAALSGTTATTDVTLSGSAHYIAGGDDETGTVTLQATSGASRMDLNLSSGPRSEIMNTSGAPPAGSWSGPDSVSHPISYHNLLTNPAWFFPAFPIANGLSSGYATTYIGQETRNGQAVQHLSVSQIFTSQTPDGTPTMAHLSQMDFFLDATTFLPVFPQPSPSTSTPTTTWASTSPSKSASPTIALSAAPKSPSTYRNS